MVVHSYLARELEGATNRQDVGNCTPWLWQARPDAESSAEPAIAPLRQNRLIIKLWGLVGSQGR